MKKFRIVIICVLVFLGLGAGFVYCGDDVALREDPGVVDTETPVSETPVSDRKINSAGIDIEDLRKLIKDEIMNELKRDMRFLKEEIVKYKLTDREKMLGLGEIENVIVNLKTNISNITPELKGLLIKAMLATPVLNS